MALSSKSSKLIDKQPTHVRTLTRNGKTYWVDGIERMGETWFVSIREEHGQKWWWIEETKSK